MLLRRSRCAFSSCIRSPLNFSAHNTVTCNCFSDVHHSALNNIMWMSWKHDNRHKLPGNDTKCNTSYTMYRQKQWRIKNKQRISTQTEVCTHSVFVSLVYFMELLQVRQDSKVSYCHLGNVEAEFLLRMAFLLPNQQHQSTEGYYALEQWFTTHFNVKT